MVKLCNYFCSAVGKTIKEIWPKGDVDLVVGGVILSVYQCMIHVTVRLN